MAVYGTPETLVKPNLHDDGIKKTRVLKILDTSGKFTLHTIRCLLKETARKKVTIIFRIVGFQLIVAYFILED